MAENKKSITKPHKGLYTDASPLEQPPGTYRFALNAVNETELGDLAFNSNEESNEQCFNLPTGYIPLGKVYIGDNKTVIFSVSSDGVMSEIGIVDAECKYVTHVNGPLGFKVTHQIDATYRLRKGCERNIYWVDGANNKPFFFNFDKPENFKTSGIWDLRKFELMSSYDSVPTFNKIEVLNSGGQTEAGSYNIAVQYLDNDLNPTEWITVSDIIYIYNDSLEKDFKNINGSINSDVEYIDFPTTNKAIKVVLGNLDKSFIFYRLAFIEATSGTGQITRVTYSDKIPTAKNFFIYTGANYLELGTQEEIAMFSTIVDSAGSIEQIENRLILGNIEGPQIDFCKLQKYASRIKADCVTKKVILNNLVDPANQKNPTHRMEALGYMPGESYSFGIVYLFEDGSISPTYHIPGKNPNVELGTVFSVGANTYPMGSVNLNSSTYTDNSTCNNYWGVDSEGETLTGKFIRHHRFPLRTEINKPLVVQEDTSSGSVEYYNLVLRIQGDLITPVLETDIPNIFEVRVSYQVDGQQYSFNITLDASAYVDGTGEYTIDMYQYSQYHGSDAFTDISISVTDALGNYGAETPVTLLVPTGVPEDDSYFTGQASYVVTSEVYDSTTTSNIYSTEILGIKFSGIEPPALSFTNGKRVTGYYIVRNERTEFDKTILDSGVLIPSMVNSKYVSHGLLQPEVTDATKLDPSVYGVIHPEHKFNNKEYTAYDTIIQQGNFTVVDKKYGKVNYDDVYDGSSYNSKYQKDGNDDGHEKDNSPTSRGLDGWSFNLITRDNILQFNQSDSFVINNNEIKERFYLNALESRSINGNSKEVFNISSDNRIGIIQLEDIKVLPPGNNLPYVIFYKENLDVYSNFRNLPYYKQNDNPVMFANPGSNQITVFKGDSYVSPMRYVNTVYWDNRIAKRRGRTSALKKILGAAVAVLGGILVATGIGAAAGTLIIGAGITIIGGGALLISSGIKQSSFNRAYSEEYEKGLRETALDNWVDRFYNYRDTIPFGFQGNGRHGYDGPSDDTIQWIGDCLTDLWFESTVNTNLRNHMITDTPTFLNAPGDIETGNDTPILTWEFFKTYYTSSNGQRHPISTLENHIVKKLLAFDPERDDNRYYIGVALGEYYNLNPDYTRLNKGKIYNHLALEYDCCSNCQEKFPHRVMYSEQSFQEELSDNYRVFLPNNYRDIEGEKGQITNLYRLQNNLYIHTEEALWHLPQNYQERVTNDIVSFIGTGSYFETPPRKIADDSISAGGTQHKWGAIKTKHGILFPSQIDKKIYLFTGNELKALSDVGNSNWFKENMDSIVATQYYKSNGRVYPFFNNPSNLYGEGFISAYDTKKERFIVTKKDLSMVQELVTNPDYELCVNNELITVFNDYQQTIDTYNTNGFDFVGIENCRMKFEKIEYVETQETRQRTITVPNDTDIHIFYDTSGSFDASIPGSRPLSPSDDLGPTLGQINSAVDDWLLNFAVDNPGWGGTLYKYIDSTEKWVNYAQVIGDTTYNGQSINGKNIIVISFCNESQGSAGYHGDTLQPVLTPPSGTYMTDYNNFITLHNMYGSFIGIHYPIVFPNMLSSKEFVSHSLAALKGRQYSMAELAALNYNNGMTNTEWNTMLGALGGANSYPHGLENYGWLIKEDRFKAPGGEVIDSEIFQEDINELLKGSTTVEEYEVTVLVPEVVTEYVEGTILNANLADLNNSWTMSYSLKDAVWISWHSYIPNFYYYISDKFYSWKFSNDGVYKHNVIGKYQQFYGERFPYIIEYVSLPDPIQTKIWDNISLHTEARRYFPSMKQYVDEREITFNKAILYNTRQTTGLVNLVNKNTRPNPEDYFSQQVVNSNNGDIIIDRNERNWSFNDIRDIRVDYTQPIFDASLEAVQGAYYIDKVLNLPTLDVNKDWTQLESFRDKYLVVRLIFDNFDDVKLIMNYSDENEYPSFR